MLQLYTQLYTGLVPQEWPEWPYMAALTSFRKKDCFQAQIHEYLEQLGSSLYYLWFSLSLKGRHSIHTHSCIWGSRTSCLTSCPTLKELSCFIHIQGTIAYTLVIPYIESVNVSIIFLFYFILKTVTASSASIVQTSPAVTMHARYLVGTHGVPIIQTT